MPDPVKYVVLDGTAHVLAGDEHTACYLVVPANGTYSTEQPDDLCAECAEKAGLDVKKAKGAKAKG